jgi:hypothetical protein
VPVIEHILKWYEHACIKMFRERGRNSRKVR